MTQWAVFDADGTLLPHTSMEKMLWKALLKRGAIPPLNFFKYLFKGISKTLIGKPDEGFKANKSYLEGISAKKLEHLADWLFEQKIKTSLSKTGLETIDKNRQSGIKIMLMSGSPDVLTTHLASKIKSDFVITCQLEIKDGIYTGNIVGLHPYGERKKQLLVATQKETQIDFDESIVYANHHSDAIHMEMFCKAVAVNPTPALKKIAAKRNWEIQIWD